MTAELTCDPFAALNEALCHEEEARQFYIKAAERTADRSGAQMFRDLANTASTHIAILEQQVESLSNQDRWILPECALGCEADLTDPFFPRGYEALKEAIRSNADDNDAIIFALERVQKGHAMYREAALSALDPIARRIYEYLTEEAKTQRDLLMLSFERVAPYPA